MIYKNWHIFIIVLLCLPVYCMYDKYLKISIDEEKLKPAMREFVQENSLQFQTPYTFIIMLDENACAGNLSETQWWPHWQQYLHEKGINYIYATSRADSAGLNYALSLEGMSAPVLVFPGCEKHVSDLWHHRSMILKILYESSTGYYYSWLGSILDSADGQRLLDRVDSITVNTKNEDIH